MPRGARIAPGKIVLHVLNRANARSELFHKPEDYSAFERIMISAMQRTPIRLLGILSLTLFLLTVASHGEIEAGWQKKWQATVQAAKREGQLTVYVSGYGATLDAGHFQKDFPEIKLVTVTGQSGQLGPRILSERRAGKYLADVSSAGANPNYQLFTRPRSWSRFRPR